MNGLFNSWRLIPALVMLIGWSASAVEYPGKVPGAAKAGLTAGQYMSLSNEVIRQSWAIFNGHLVPATLRDNLSGRDLEAPKEAFVLTFHDGRMLKAGRMKASRFKVEELAGLPGKQVSAVLLADDGSVQVVWRAMLRDESNVIRQEITVSPLKGDADIARVILVDHWLREGRIAGQVHGSPLVSDTLFTGFEHPMSVTMLETGGAPQIVPVPGSDENALAPESLDRGQSGASTAPRWGKAHAQAWLDLTLPIRKGQSLRLSSVIGIVPEGQLRRGFLYYLERERAHTYRTFLHYNSWYDIGFFTPYNEQDCLKVIQAFGDQLVTGRGVRMDSFLFDDGWDDTSKGGQWVFHQGFKNGFKPVKAAAARIGAEPGVWLSPWGGYGKPRIERRRSGQAAGYETVTDPWDRDPEYGQLFALSGPRYFASFHKACLGMVTDQGINHFKLDGTGSINSVMPGSQFSSDFAAAISLIQDLRRAKPDLFINLTTGTWPSPFWLTICDSIWRGGWDHSFAGEGSDRERWITYRDADTYERVVKGGPLYPLNSLMLHGIIYARKAKGLDVEGGKAFEHEVRSYFGTGTQLQEMYISHDLLTPENWDCLAESAKWSRSNAESLVDTHWVGGDPQKRQVYGWAGWSPTKGVITLRNPSASNQVLILNLAEAFELPEDAADLYTVKSPYAQRAIPELEGRRNAYKPVKITLKPFEVLVFEALPIEE